jgi:hypothetical protein
VAKVAAVNGDEEQTREQPENSPAEDEGSDTASGRDEGDAGSEPDEPVGSGSGEKQAEAEADSDESGSQGQDDSGGGGEAPAGPSLGPHTDLGEFQKRREEHYERMRENEPSQEDAMGLDKRRTIVGGTYGPTRTRLIATFTVTIAIIAAAGVGIYLLVGELDQAPKNDPAKAPWSASNAPQKPPKSIQ